MKASLLTTSLVLALGMQNYRISALPTAPDVAVEATVTTTSVANPDTMMMEKRTFNPLRGCWKHHCNPPLDKCQKKCDRANPKRLDKEYHQNKQERNSCKDECYYLLSGDGNWKEMGLEGGKEKED
ncbi:hypothetical protein KC331_g13445 [Hortaea werneckii]|uniref:Secreted protein n=1 Tax=Hortaea werneckii TaxID=91943 RepID=A0A3M7AMI6_HORWE|nr:hypothetical protein KC331_g13445 [Hortaea werneckii]KAI7705443.1 hypothetical protein KC353_g12873 [Hortaea werneckii]RMY28638.1 hypothetical protein D0865_15714 [Hortaea werneckii]